MKQRGFTLLEILIALVIFALLSAAISGQTRSSVRALHAVDLKLDAQLLAENIAERQANPETQTAYIQDKSETLTHNGRNWSVEQAFSATARPDMHKLIIRVFAIEPGVIESQATPDAELTTYVLTQSEAGL